MTAARRGGPTADGLRPAVGRQSVTSQGRLFWSTTEMESLEPYIQALARGKYRSASLSAKAYMAEASCPLSEASS